MGLYSLAASRTRSLWASSTSICRACLRKMPQIERLQADYGDRGLKVLAINVEGNREVVQRFLRSKPTRLTVLLDDGRLAEQYAAFALPHVALIDRQGRLAYTGAGVGLAPRVRALIEREAPASQPTSPR